MSLSSTPVKAHAFTLLELLVAMSVLTMLVVLVLQIVTTSSDAVSSNSKRLKMLTAGTFILDRMESDFAARLKSQPLSFFLLKETGSDAFALYSEVQGYSGVRKLAAVQYRVTSFTPPSTGILERGVSGTGWTDLFPLSLPSADPADFETLSDLPFRMEMAFISTSGQITALPPSDQSGIAAVIVAVALVDPSSREIMTDTQLESLANALPDSVDGEEPLATWEEARKQPGFAAGIPLKVLQNVQFFQRTFHVR